jgi:hypothetical protein
MTTPYSVTTSKGSVSYDNYVNAPITGPLSTNQYPATIPYHSYGTLIGIRPTPPQFYPLQEPVYSEMNTNMRQQYLRTSVNPETLEKQKNLAKLSPPMSFHSMSTNKQYAVSTHMNYIEPISSSMYVNIKKSNAVGQSGYKVNLPNSAPISTKNYFPSGTRSSLRRVRSGGCVAPAKKGSIHNYSLSNGGTCCWGSIHNQKY